MSALVSGVAFWSRLLRLVTISVVLVTGASRVATNHRGAETSGVRIWRRILTLSVAVATGACHRRAPAGAPPTTAPDSLARIAISRPACQVPPTDSSGTRWPIDSANHVAIRLPARFQPTPARLAERRRWQAPDSTRIELWMTAAPVSSVGGSGVAQFGGEPACTLVIGGRAAAIVVRYWVIFTGRRDTLYDAATAAVVAPGQAVDAVISSRSRATRDELLGALAALELPAPARTGAQ